MVSESKLRVRTTMLVRMFQMNFATLFAEMMSDTVAMLILVLVSQTKKPISSLAIPTTGVSFPKFHFGLVVFVDCKLHIWFL